LFSQDQSIENEPSADSDDSKSKDSADEGSDVEEEGSGDESVRDDNSHHSAGGPYSGE